MKVLIVSDKIGSAIDRIAKMIQAELPHLAISVCQVHPKRPDERQLAYFAAMAKDADIIDFEYWKTAEMLLAKFPLMTKGRRTILAHHNPYDLKRADWSKYDVLLAKNREIFKILDDSRYTHIPVDLKQFTFGTDYHPENKMVLMVAARIEAKKGILEVAKACKDLGYKFTLVGTVSDQAYFDEIESVGVDFVTGLSNAELLEYYHKATVHVCNSDDNFESGTMPILEAMASGCPVLTRSIGHVPDFFDGKNVSVRWGKRDDMEDLMNALRGLVEDEKKLREMREDAFVTVLNYSASRMAWFYEKLYWELMGPKPLVSIIIPTHNRVALLEQNLQGILKSQYPKFEIIIADDQSSDGTDIMVNTMRRTTTVPIKYIRLEGGKYNLGLARNKAAIEAAGELLIFLDDRQAMEPDAIDAFVEHMGSKKWLWGIKSGVVKGFVENFAAIRREDFINAGMFAVGFPWGFLSQETRERFSAQGFKFERVSAAHATTMIDTKSKYRKRAERMQSKDLLWKMGYGN